MVVYGLHTIADRKTLWSELQDVAGNSTEPIMYIRYFNVVLNVHDRINGVDISEQETHDFSEFMMVTHMLEAPNCGVFYSWSNKGSGPL